MRALLLATLLAAGAATPARADIYTWRDETGASRMSNLAPPWYSPTERSRIRTQVLVNGHVVDDTGLPPSEREKLQSRRAAAQSWGRAGSTPSRPATLPSNIAPPLSAPAAAAPQTPAQAAPTPPLSAFSPEDLKRAREAQDIADELAEKAKANARPK